MEMTFANEQDLIRRARARDPMAFEQLVNAHTANLFRVVRRMTGNSMEAEGIVQETFWRVWQALPRYQEDRRFFPYLVTIAANLVRDAWRKERRMLPGKFEEETSTLSDEWPTPELQLEEAELLQDLAKAIEELQPLYRSMIALRYDADLSYDECARALNLPVNTVRTHLRRAKLALRKKLERFYGKE
jgi:RNA polymerase sigma-70 factor (ECF subfamily)